MATPLPAKLKSADCQRFATRAAQLSKHRPIVSYWCEYHILHTILNKHLHTTDSECQTYALHLMDKLEAVKTSHPHEDAITDDLAAQAYVEAFALETFARADEAQRTNKVTRQTADTFQAAATFLDLLGIWGPLGEEMKVKSKFAKFHALRIARAIKAGEDPNASNPVVEEPPAPPVEGAEGIEQELKELERASGGGGGGGGGGTYQPPTVESAPDSKQPSRPGSAIHDVPPPLPTRTTSTSRETAADVSPIDPAGGDAERQASIGGGYFPSVPSAMSDLVDPVDTDMSGTEGADIAHQEPPPSMHTAAAAAGAPPTVDAEAFYNPSQPPAEPTPKSIHAQSVDLGLPTPYAPPPPLPLPVGAAAGPEHLPQAPPQVQTQAPQSVQASSAAPHAPPAVGGGGGGDGGYRTDDESVLAAQKHAKWAISALNFEDVATAVKELRGALRVLGAGG